MPKRAEPLIAKELTCLPIGWHCDGGGLYLQVSSGGRAWVYRYMIRGRRRDMGLGPYPLRSLSEARQRASDARRLVLDGIDPIDQRLHDRGIEAKAKIQRTTFREAAEAYIAAHEAEWRNEKHRAQWRSTLETYAYPIIGGLAVGAIGTDEILKVLAPIWTTKPETASRVRGRIETVLAAAAAAKMRDGENPATWATLRHLLPAKAKVARVEHYAAAGIDDMPAIMKQLARIDTMAARALEFMILTAARTGEVLRATWSEIDLDRALWTIPPERMKAGREHRVPLPVAAVSILRALHRVAGPGGFIFQGQRAGYPLSNMALLMLLRRMKHGDLTAHGFRSTFRDWCAERTAFPGEVAEMALAHAVGDKVEAAYRRGDLFAKRRELADAWSAHCGV